MIHPYIWKLSKNLKECEGFLHTDTKRSRNVKLKSQVTKNCVIPFFK